MRSGPSALSLLQIHKPTAGAEADSCSSPLQCYQLNKCTFDVLDAMSDW